MMRRVISGVTYLLVGCSVVLIVLVIFVNFKSQVFDRVFFDEEKQIETIGSSKENNANANGTDDFSGAPEVLPPTQNSNTPTHPVPSGNISVNVAESIVYDGELELPVSGATGYASVEMEVYNDEITVSLATLKPGKGFVILSEYGPYWRVCVKSEADGRDIIGWVYHSLCLINLPDVIPSIVYNNTNAYRSVFRANGEAIPNITGKQLYSYSERSDGKVYNERLQRYEYIVPVLYSMAKRVCAAQQNALAGGDSLVIYEGFRPQETQQSVFRAVNNLPASQKKFGSWSQGWFIASGKSNHQIGYAMDASLAQVVEVDEKVTGKYRYKQLVHFEYTMPTQIHELSVDSALYASPGSRTYSEGVKNSEPAQRLQKYCTSAGFTPLASEWWHFNDEYARAGITRESSGNFLITECFSASPAG